MNEIINYLNSLYLDSFKNFHYAYFWNYFDEPTEDEIKEFGENISIICFRTVGYTIGHVILDRNLNIIKFIVYDNESVNQFKLNHNDLETELNKRFIGKNLML